MGEACWAHSKGIRSVGSAQQHSTGVLRATSCDDQSCPPKGPQFRRSQSDHGRWIGALNENFGARAKRGRIPERVAAKVIESGFTVRQTVVLLSTIYNYTLSFAMEEQAVFPRPGERSAKYDLKKEREA